MTLDSSTLSTSLKQRMEQELRGNILPFWIQHAVDTVSGGFYGAIRPDLVVENSVERSLVLCARMLWTYSAAYRFYRDPEYLQVARHAYQYLTGPFLDKEYGGFYWGINASGQPVYPRKQTYGQAFAIYALSELHRATGEEEPLRMAQEAYLLVEQHVHDSQYGGYIEGRARDWGALDDMRLSEKEVNTPKSMNTLLHILEAYTNLLRAWEDPVLRSRLADLVEIFLTKVIDPSTGFDRLFFQMDWTPVGDAISYGHDIEASWLLAEAAALLDEPLLTARVTDASLRIADAVHAQGMDSDGSIFYEGTPLGITNDQKHWWVHAEGVVGFYNAFQLCPPEDTERRKKYLAAAIRLWDYIEAEFVDRRYGEWYKVLDRSGTPIEYNKAGPWEDPYHQSRACMEIITRA